MLEVGSTKRCQEDWSNLPHDLLSQIVHGLELKELQSLRGVCKDWRHVSTKTFIEQIESFGYHHWFLLYGGGGSKCSLLRDQYKISITIPELDGATCLASHEGWLLVFRGGSLFFYCPFSGAKIDLPSCPFITELPGHTGAFSAPPTCQDCNVVVIRRSSATELELHLLSRGHETWTKYKFSCRQTLGKIMTAVFRDGLFRFSDSIHGLVTFRASTKRWNCYRSKTIGSKEDSPSGKLRPCPFLDRLRLLENADSISTCRTLHKRDYGIVRGESIETAIGSESRRHLKGIWIMPIFDTPSMDQRW